jgi:hypothetical protein
VNKMHWLDTGQWPCYIGFTTSEQAYNRCMKRMSVSDPSPWIAHARAGATMHTLTNDTSLTLIICISPPSRKHSKEQYAALIAHEALHVVQQMEREYYPSGRFDDESAAYLLQHIVQHCLQHAWATGRTRKTAP